MDRRNSTHLDGTYLGPAYIIFVCLGWHSSSFPNVLGFPGPFQRLASSARAAIHEILTSSWILAEYCFHKLFSAFALCDQPTEVCHILFPSTSWTDSFRLVMIWKPCSDMIDYENYCYWHFDKCSPYSSCSITPAPSMTPMLIRTTTVAICGHCEIKDYKNSNWVIMFSSNGTQPSMPSLYIICFIV